MIGTARWNVRVKAWAVAAAAVSALALLAAAPAAKAQGQQAGQGARPAQQVPFFPKPILPGQTAGQHYDNIHVLKKIPAEQLIPTMQYIAASLGVQCNYCHVQNENERDDKKTKLKAREMMKMVIRINKTSFDNAHKVECYTCHNGSPIPQSIPQVVELGVKPRVPQAGERVPGEAGPPVPPKVAEALPSPDQLISNYEQAIAGTAAVSSLTTRVARGSFEAGPARGEFEQSFKAPDKLNMVTRGRQGETTEGFDGRTVWVRNPQGRVRELVGPQGLDQRRLADFYRSLDLKRSYKAFHDVAKATVGGREAYLVQADAADGTGTDNLYFDASSGLLVRVVQLIPTFFGELPTQYDYSDYRDAGGVKVPFEVRLGKPDFLTMFHFSEIRFNQTVEDSIFNKPPDKAPAPASASR
jgi:photosynthetic reaction center cytochrome c subunit